MNMSDNSDNVFHQQITENYDDDVMITEATVFSDYSVYIASSSVIGRRKEQQDSVKCDNEYDYKSKGRCICVLCDGMGGLSGGRQASQLCVNSLVAEFHKTNRNTSIPSFYRQIIPKLDKAVHSFKDKSGKPMKCGTTLVSCVIKDDELYWASVGDCHAYILRNNQLSLITREHNLGMLLEERAKRGELTYEQAESHPKKEALVSFIGLGRVPYMDLRVEPFKLSPGDFIIICSDGLYRSVTEYELKNTVLSYGRSVRQSAEALTERALSKNKPNQDNTSVIVVGFFNS